MTNARLRNMTSSICPATPRLLLNLMQRSTRKLTNLDQKKPSKSHHAGTVRNESGMPMPTIIVTSGGSSS
jgi:hypothetical protein